MSKNINQIATAAASILATDKLYLGRSPFGITDDRYILGSSIISQFSFSSPLTTKGDLYTFTTVDARLAVGTVNGQILQVNSGAATGLTWSTPTYPSASGSAGKLLRSDGTNNVYTTLTFPDTVSLNAILYGNVANNVGPITPAINSVLVSDGTTGIPTWSTTLPAGLTIPGYQTTITFPLALNLGGTNANLTANNGGIFYSTATAGAILAGTATASKMLLSGATAAPTWSTSTIPSSSGATANKVLLSDGTNYVLSIPTFPNASATSGKIIISDGTNWIASTPTYPALAGTSGNILTSDGTNWTSASAAGIGSPLTTKGDIYAFSTTNARFPVAVGDGKILQVSSGATFGIAYSTPTYPSTSGSSGKILISDGTNNIYSTPTYPSTAGTSGNVLTSDGTNWTSVNPAPIAVNQTLPLSLMLMGG